MTDPALERLEAAHDWIPWRSPTKVIVPSLGEGLGCRVCIAVNGIRGVDVVSLPQSPEAFAAHFLEAHGVEAVPA